VLRQEKTEQNSLTGYAALFMGYIKKLRIGIDGYGCSYRLQQGKI